MGHRRVMPQQGACSHGRSVGRRSSSNEKLKRARATEGRGERMESFAVTIYGDSDLDVKSQYQRAIGRGPV